MRFGIENLKNLKDLTKRLVIILRNLEDRITSVEENGGGTGGGAGTITSVNGDTGPEVTLNKNDIGLDQVDNTSDASKAAVGPIKVALDLKSNVGHTHSISDVTGLQDELDTIPATLFDLGITDGADGQVLKTDGAGNLSFESVGSTDIIVDKFTGDGSTVDFTLSRDPSTLNNLQIYFNGLRQEDDGYTYSGTTVTFLTSPANGLSIHIIQLNSNDIGVPSDDTVSTAKIQDEAVTRDQIQTMKKTTKFLASDIASSVNNIAALSMNNLVIGRWYKITFQAVILGGNSSGRVIVRSGITPLMYIIGGTPQESTNDRHGSVNTMTFQAVATNIRVDWARFSTPTLEGTGDGQGTWISLEEVPYNIIEDSTYA